MSERLFRVVIIGGSAGALGALLTLLPQLREDFPHAMVIVLHRRGSSDSSLADLLALRLKLPLREIEDKDAMKGGIVFLAPGDYHLLFEKNGTLSLDDSEKVAYSRPSINVAFQSVADAYGAVVIAVLLSGANADGSEGLNYIKSHGGITVAQHPDSAEFPYMPKYAIDKSAVDFVFDMPALAKYLNGL